MRRALVAVLLAVYACAANGATERKARAMTPDQYVARGDSCAAALDSWNAFLNYTAAARIGAPLCTTAWRLARTYTAFALTARDRHDEAWNYEHAETQGEKAVACDPDNVPGLLALAVYQGWRTFMEQDNQAKLRASRLMHEAVTKVLALDPDNDFAWNLHGQWNREVSKLSWVEKLVVRIIYGGLPDASFDEAVRDFRKAIALKPGRIMHYVELGKTYRAMGDEQNARAAWQQALAFPNIDGVDAREKDEAQHLLDGGH